MSPDAPLKIGFLRPGVGSAHYDEFAAMTPPGVDLDMRELGVMRNALTDFAGQADAVVERVASLTREAGWEGVIIPGAPVEEIGRAHV